MLALSLPGAVLQLTQRTRSAEIAGAQTVTRRTQVRIIIKLQRKLLVKRSHKANLLFLAIEARYKYPISKPVYAPQIAKSKGFKISESSLVFSPNLRQFSVLINKFKGRLYGTRYKARRPKETSGLLFQRKLFELQ
jgi:hypothetical protein